MAKVDTISTQMLQWIYNLNEQCLYNVSTKWEWESASATLLYDRRWNTQR